MHAKTADKKRIVLLRLTTGGRAVTKVSVCEGFASIYRPPKRLVQISSLEGSRSALRPQTLSVEGFD